MNLILRNINTQPHVSLTDLSAVTFQLPKAFATSAKSFDFTLFKSLENGRFKNIPDIWLQWFIGFSEGDASFSTYLDGTSKRETFAFKLELDLGDLAILQEIKKTFGFGDITVNNKKQAPSCSYRVRALNDVYSLIQLFNGNLIFPHRKQQLLSIISSYNKRMEEYKKNSTYPHLQKNLVVPIFTELLPTLEDAWLSGLTDAEGCFFVGIYKKDAKMRFDISQTGKENRFVLEHLAKLFTVGAVYADGTNHFVFQVCGIQNCFKIYPYFETFPLRAIKQKSFALWREVHAGLAAKGHHKNSSDRERLIELSLKINPKEKP